MSLNKWLGIIPNASADGTRIDGLLEFCHWFMLILFIGWSLFFLYTIWRFHQSRQPQAVHDGAQGHVSTHLEFSVVLVEAVLLLGFAIPIWANSVAAFPSEEKAIVVRAVAEQFNWNFHYPGPDKVFGRTDPHLVTSSNPLGLDANDPYALDDIVVKNEMHLPVNQPAIIKISSKDVIHNYAAPAMRVSQDAIPGMQIPLWFIPTKISPQDEFGLATPYEIICGQLCGSGHGLMRAVLYVDEQEKFDQWLEGSPQAIVSR